MTPRKLGFATSIASFGQEQDGSSMQEDSQPLQLEESSPASKGIGVLYDDPVAREEQRRLLNLLNGGEASPPPTVSSGRAKSGRKSSRAKANLV